MGNRKNDYEKKTTTKLLGIFCVEKYFKNVRNPGQGQNQIQTVQ